jgi:ceramide glucosyltransferase
VIIFLLAVISIAGCGYLLYALTRVNAYQPMPDQALVAPRVTIFKPLCGADPGLYENLCSFCEQDYPQYDVLFCVRDGADPAVGVARRVMAAYPGVACTLIVDDSHASRNPKVANMMSGRAAARGEIFAIADADVRVAPGMLRALAAAFDDTRAGAASCLYRAQTIGSDLPSRLHALHVNDHFLPSVLVAAARRSPGFCLGAVMAVRRSAFDAIGGFDAIGAYLGDDFALGKLTSERGYDVKLVPHVVSCMVKEPTLRACFAHQLRWARTIRFQAPLGYAFLFVTTPLPFALALLAVAGLNPWTAFVASAVIGSRLWLQEALRKKFGVDRGIARPLVLLSDLFELGTWVCSFFGTTVDWRGGRYSAIQERAPHPK